MGRLLSKTGNLKTRKVKKRDLATETGRKKRGGRGGEREGRNGF